MSYVGISLTVNMPSPPPGIVRALPGINGPDWTYDSGTGKVYWDPQHLSTNVFTICVDSMLELRIYKGKLQPGQQVPDPDLITVRVE